MAIETAELPRANGSVPLADLAPGADAVIDRVEAASSVGERLRDLGFLPKTPIRVLRRAPLGDPIEYELRGYRLCLRSSEAARIRVQPVRGSNATPL
jgi:Fe2+ transport system protein FeoA